MSYFAKLDRLGASLVKREVYFGQNDNSHEFLIDNSDMTLGHCVKKNPVLKAQEVILLKA